MLQALSKYSLLIIIWKYRLYVVEIGEEVLLILNMHYINDLQATCLQLQKVIVI